LSFTLLPGVVLAYLPTWFGQIPPILFGLGAIAVAKNPSGLLAMLAHLLSVLVLRLRRPKSQPVAPAPVGAGQPGVGAGVGR
jgi:branched-chain amino acid transport system permease protein